MQTDKSQTSGDFSKNYTWSSIFSIDEDDYQECLEWARRYYQNVTSENYADVVNCVKHALENDNHSAFAHFFLQDKYDQKSVFRERLNSLIRQQEQKTIERDANKDSTTRKKAKSFIEEVWETAPIIKARNWRSLNSTIYPLRDSIDIKIIYSDAGKRKWRRGSSIPPRDVIIQIGIILSLTPDETNTLLLAAGESVLYVLDVVDVCSIFALEKYRDKFDIEPKTKLIEAKNEIDRVLTEYQKQGVPFSESKDGFQIASNKPFINTIETDIAELRGLLEEKEPDKADRLQLEATNTTFLTKYYQEEIRRLLNDNNTAEFIKLGNLGSTQGNDLNNTSIVFLHKYYGFLKKTREFLLASANYQKNIAKGKCEWDLTTRGYTVVRDILYKEQQNSSGTDVPQPNINVAIRTVEKILRTTDIDSHPCAPRGSLSLIRQLAEGRNIIPIAKKREKEETKKYQMDLSSHITLIRFLVATGNEDKIDYYMNLSGMWNRNWYAEYRNAYRGSSGVESLQKENYLSRIDFLILYALLYRDALINEWQTSAGLSEPDKERIRNIFPMIKLLLVISRDIVLAFMKLDKSNGSGYGDYDNAKNNSYKGGLVDYEKKLLRMMNHELAFPITWYFCEILQSDNNRETDSGTNRQQHLQLNKGENDDLNNTPSWKRKIPL